MKVEFHIETQTGVKAHHKEMDPAAFAVLKSMAKIDRIARVDFGTHLISIQRVEVELVFGPNDECEMKGMVKAVKLYDRGPYRKQFEISKDQRNQQIEAEIENEVLIQK